MNASVKVNFEFGIVVRKDAITKKDIPVERILTAFETHSPFDENDTLLSFGPHFGIEAMEEFGKRLTLLGLDFLDDYFYFYSDFPDWAEFSVRLKR